MAHCLSDVEFLAKLHGVRLAFEVCTTELQYPTFLCAMSPCATSSYVFFCAMSPCATSSYVFFCTMCNIVLCFLLCHVTMCNIVLRFLLLFFLYQWPAFTDLTITVMLGYFCVHWNLTCKLLSVEIVKAHTHAFMHKCTYWLNKIITEIKLTETSGGGG